MSVSLNKMNKDQGDANIRRFRPDSDVMEVCNIWVNGLEWCSSKWWPFGGYSEAVKMNDDVGPNAQNLYKRR